MPGVLPMVKKQISNYGKNIFFKGVCIFFASSSVFESKIFETWTFEICEKRTFETFEKQTFETFETWTFKTIKNTNLKHEILNLCISNSWTFEPRSLETS